MTKTKNTIWRFFASVKLALITLIILATISIIGTLIKQGQPADYYVGEYGQDLARLFEQLNFTSMYSAWWFVALLCLFAINLVVCSIERLPGVWRLVAAETLDIESRQIERMGSTHRIETGLTTSAAAERINLLLVDAGWRKPRRADRDGSTLYAVQKGAWTRFGVYIVHLSILIILTGAIIGSVFGFQAYVFIPEGASTSEIYLRKNKEPVPLGFQLQNDWFERSFYPNGMIKQYRVDLSVIDPQRPGPLKKSVMVNDPLTYRGLTFFVGDGFPMNEYLVRAQNRHTGIEQWLRASPEQEVVWQGQAFSFRIEELEFDEDGNALRARFEFDPGSVLWIDSNRPVNVWKAGEEYTVSYRQLNSTLLLVTKDPGVLTVYIGFFLMVLGLAISFFMSHRRIWVHIAPNGKSGAKIMIGGSSNKNKPAFARRFEEFVAILSKDKKLYPRNKKK
jgi:cytochrome c biogenesis protein